MIKGIFSESFWYMLPILSSITVTVTGIINSKFNITKGFLPQLISWIVGAVLGVGGWYFDYVQVGDPTWLSVVVLCGCIGLVSNGIYDVPAIKSLVDKLRK